MDSPNQPTLTPSSQDAVPIPEEVSAAPVAISPLSDPPREPRLARRRVVAADFGGDLTSSLQSLMGTIVIALFVITFVVQAFQIPSESMKNTLLVGDYLLVN